MKMFYVFCHTVHCADDKNSFALSEIPGVLLINCHPSTTLCCSSTVLLNYHSMHSILEMAT